MKTFNRIVIIFALLVLMAACTLLFIFPHPVLTTVGQWLVDLGEQILQIVPGIRLAVGVVLALIFNVIAIFLIYLEVRKQRARFIRVKELSGGMATLNVDSIKEQLQYRIDPLPNVVNVASEIKAKGQKVGAVVNVTVAPGSNVPEMASRLVEVSRDVLSRELGLEVAGDPEIRMTVAGHGEKGRPAARRERPQEQSRPREERPLPEPEPEWSFSELEEEDGGAGEEHES